MRRDAEIMIIHVYMCQLRLFWTNLANTLRDIRQKQTFANDNDIHSFVHSFMHNPVFESGRVNYSCYNYNYIIIILLCTFT